MPILPRILLLLLTISMVLGILFVGLYPFNYFPENRVSLNEDGNGLHFFGRGIAYSTEVGDWPRKGPFTLELILKPERTYRHRTPHILSLCDKSGRKVVYLGQWEDSLIVRIMENSRWIEKVKGEIGAWNVLNRGEAFFLTLVLSNDNTYIYGNGQFLGESGQFDFAKALFKRPIRFIVFGNSPDGDNPWRGRILRFSAINSVLNSDAIRDRYAQWSSGDISETGAEFIKYGFEEFEGGIIRNQPGNGWDLRVSKTLAPLKRNFLSLPSIQYLGQKSFYKDAVINIVGFIPLGLFLTILLAGTPGKEYSGLYYLRPVLINGLISLFIETNQVFLVSRTSSITDLILNILGSGLGVAVYWGLKKTSVKDFIHLRY